MIKQLTLLMTVVMAVTVLGRPTLAQAPAEPAAPSTQHKAGKLTHEAVREQTLRFERERAWASWKTGDARRLAQSDAAKIQIDRAAAWVLGEDVDAPNAYTELQKLVEARGYDSLIRAYHTSLRTKSAMTGESGLAIIQELKNVPHAALARGRLAQVVARRGDFTSANEQWRARREQLPDEVAAAFIEDLTDPALPADLQDHRVSFWSWLFEDDNRDFLDATVVRVKQSDAIPKWLKLYVEGHHELALAWRARTHGFAKEVTPEAWAAMQGHIKAAREALEASYRERDDLPYAASAMIEVSLLTKDHKADIRRWFDLTRSIQPDEPTAWRRMRKALQPRWYGSYDELLALGLLAAESARYETMLPMELQACLLGIIEETTEPERVVKHPGVWAKLDRMYTGMVTPNRFPTDLRRILSAHAAASLLAGHPERALDRLRALRAAGLDLHWPSVHRWKASTRELEDLKFLELAGLAEVAVKALKSADERRWDDALGALRGTAGEALDADARYALADLTWLIGARAGIDRGEGFELSTEPGRPLGVLRPLGTFESKDGAITAKGAEGHRGGIPVSVGHRYELSCEVALPDKQALPGTSGGLLFSYELHALTPTYMKAVVRFDRGVVDIGDNGGTKQQHAIEIRDGRVSLRVLVWDTEAIIQANGKELYRGRAILGENVVLAPFVGLGSTTGTNGSVDYRRVQVRPLKTRPTELGPVAAKGGPEKPPAREPGW